MGVDETASSRMELAFWTLDNESRYEESQFEVRFKDFLIY